MDQTNLLDNLTEFSDRSRPKTAEDKNKKKSFESVSALYEGRELILNAFRSGIFPMKKRKWTKNINS